MVIARFIVELRDRKEAKWADIVRQLNAKGLATRRNQLWNSVGVKRVHKRWTGKI